MSDAAEPTARPSGTIRRRLLYAALGLLLYTLAGFFGLPALIEWLLPLRAGEALGRQVRLEEARFNPFSLTLQLAGLEIAEADDSTRAARIGRIETDLQWRSLYYWGLVFSRLDVHEPYLRVVREDAERLNWSDVLARLARAPAHEDERDGPIRFSVNNIRLRDGSLDIEDRVAGLTHTVRALDAGVPFLSGFPVHVERHVEPALSARINDAQFDLGGRTRPFGADRETVLDIRLAPFEVAPYLAYLPFEPAFALAAGQLATDLEVVFAEPEGQGPQLTIGGVVTLADVDLRDRDDRPLLALPRAEVELDRADLFAGTVHFPRIALHTPQAQLRRRADGTLDWLQLLPPTDEAAGDDAHGRPLRVTVGALEVDGGRLAFEDLAAPDGRFATVLGDIELRLDDFASDGSRPAALVVTARSDAGERLEHSGNLAVSPFELDGTLTLDGVSLPRYAPYYASQLRGAALRAGSVAAEIPYRIDAQGLRVADASLNVSGAALRLDGRKEDALALGRLEVSGVMVDVAARRVAVSRLASRGGEARLRRLADGSLELAAAFAGGSGDAPPTAGDEDAWQFELAASALDDWALHFEDGSLSPPVRAAATRVAVDVGALGTQVTAVPVRLSAVIDGGAYLASKGRLDLARQSADLRVDLKRLQLRELGRYLTAGTEASLRSAHLSLAGQLQVAAPRADGVRPVRFRGDGRVDELIGVDTLNSTDFVRWKRLGVEGLDLRSGPLALAAETVGLAGFYSRMILDSDGRLNFREIAAADAAQEARQTVREPAPLPPIRVGRVVLEDGNIEFSDRFVRPNYDANLTEVAGSLEGLSTDTDSVATLSLTAAIDHAAPVAVSGTLNPLRQDRVLDITATVRGFELPGISPYSGKYVGYGISKGKLSAELSYKVAERRLTATNRVMLDQLTFGEVVDSPDAVDLPVQLAVALLKNRRGEIDVSVPVSGTLDDPQFSVGALVWRAFFNLIVKAVSSPFALLGSLFGGGEELAWAQFAPGSVELDAATTDKLASLARALAERPGLKIELAGRIDPGPDEAGLRERWLLSRMRERRREALLDDGRDAPALELIEIPADQYEALLAEAYEAFDFKAKPRNFVGFAKSLPVDEMKALMLANAPVGEAELAALGRGRAEAVRDWLVGEGQVEAGRVFLVAPGEARAKGAPGAPATRVDFALR